MAVHELWGSAGPGGHKYWAQKVCARNDSLATVQPRSTGRFSSLEKKTASSSDAVSHEEAAAAEAFEREVQRWPSSKPSSIPVTRSEQLRETAATRIAGQIQGCGIHRIKFHGCSACQQAAASPPAINDEAAPSRIQAATYATSGGSSGSDG